MASRPAAPIPFVDLAAQHRPLGAAFARKLAQALRSSGFILGEELEAFEREMAAYLGVRHAVGVANGTDALRLACLAAGLGPGDEVIVPAHTYVATALGVSHAGAVPRFVDVDPRTFTLDPAAAERAVGPRTRALIPVHLFGQPADMDPLRDLARRRGLKIIEDAAQAHGAEYRGRKAGSLGDLACFSFYPSKNLGALGDGGLVATDDDALAAKLRRLRHMGQERKYEHLDLGWNSRLDALQAAFLRVKLPGLDAANRRRAALAERYRAALAGTPSTPPAVHEGSTHVYHLYTILHPQRDAVARRLHDAGIACGVYYPALVPFQPCYRFLGHRPGDFPVAEDLVRRSLSLPMYPELGASQVARVAAEIRAASRTRSRRTS